MGIFVTGTRRHRLRAGLLVSVIWGITASDATAGGWPQPVGKWQVIVPVSSTKANARYGVTGAKRSASKYRKWEVAPYAEYGLLQSLTLINEWAFTSDDTNYRGDHFKTQGFSRLKLGARLCLGTWEETTFSLQDLVTLHGTTSGDNPSTPRSGDVDEEVAIVMARASTLLGMEAFSVQEIGWTTSTSPAPDLIRADVTVGVKPRQGTMLLLKTMNTSALRVNADGGLYQSTKLGLSLVQDVAKGVAIEAGYEEVLTGRETLNEKTWRVGLWLQF